MQGYILMGLCRYGLTQRISLKYGKDMTVTEGFPVCGVSKAVYQFQSYAVCSNQKTDAGSRFVWYGWWGCVTDKDHYPRTVSEAKRNSVRLLDKVAGND